MKALRTYWLDVLAVVFFALISFAYFVPADLEGRILFRDDASAGRGAGQEAAEYHARTGKVSRWTNATFSGMPTYQTSPSYASTDGLSAVMNAYHLWLPENVWYVFAYLLGFYILLRAFDFRKELAVLGSILWAFSSYFFIIIAAGHIWKVMALAYLPPMIAGVVLAYRGKYLWGLILTSIFAAFEVKANHVQMTYYYLFIILFMLMAFLVQAIREKQLSRFWKATAVCFVGALIGISINLSNLYHTWQYGLESMRGKSELVKKNASNQTSTGLDRDYITQWSYGIDETWTLLVPNVKGGASVPLYNSKTAMQHANRDFDIIWQQLGQYWGEQPGTSGPVYVGAFVLMLFFLALFIVNGPMKWALLAATVLSVLLSWGRNFMPFTNFFLDYVPLYSKFRTVASILVIAEFTIPLLAMMALKKILDDSTVLAKKLKWVYVSFVLTAGVAFLFAVMPGVFFSSFVSSGESAGLQQALPTEYFSAVIGNLTEMRKAVVTADSWRSFWIITIGTLLLLFYKARKIKAGWLLAALTVLCLVDMWQVNKRYLNDAMFVEKSARELPQQMTATDKQILQDRSLGYRVMNLVPNAFSENNTSYYHKSIGGYHAAKLRRYQEMIDAYIAPEERTLESVVMATGGDMTKVDGDSVFPILNMLNAKYFIAHFPEGQTVPVQNPYAYGNAWFVNKLHYVNNANEEIAAVGQIDLQHEAVADKQFRPQLGDLAHTNGAEMDATVSLTAYEPNQLSYDISSKTGGVVVFSEIYYPEWTATIDGQPAQLGRVNYILRALKVAPGNHKVVLSFFPKSVEVTESVAYVAYIVLLLVILSAIFMAWKTRKGGKSRAEK